MLAMASTMGPLEFTILENKVQVEYSIAHLG